MKVFQILHKVLGLGRNNGCRASCATIIVSGFPEEVVMVRASVLGLALVVAVFGAVVVPEGAIAMQPGTVAQVDGRKVEADRLKLHLG